MGTTYGEIGSFRNRPQGGRVPKRPRKVNPQQARFSLLTAIAAPRFARLEQSLAARSLELWLFSSWGRKLCIDKTVSWCCV